MITWEEVDRLIDHIIPQFRREFTAMVMITRGGVIPGGMLAEAMGITHILTAAVDFPAQNMQEKAKLIAWPQFIQFPADDKLRGRPTLIVDDVWGSGRTITAVKNRVLQRAVSRPVSAFQSLRNFWRTSVTCGGDRCIHHLPWRSISGPGIQLTQEIYSRLHEAS
jgi:hypoxanthine phosphoribosyltransferase